jgi:hypothetical protein
VGSFTGRFIPRQFLKDKEPEDILPRNKFIQEFKTGVQAGIQGILNNADQLIETARQVGGEDMGEGLIDPEALNLKLYYLRLRNGGQGLSKEDALIRSQVKAGGYDNQIYDKVIRAINFGKQNDMISSDQEIEIKTALAGNATSMARQEKMIHISNRGGLVKPIQGIIGSNK